MVGGCNALLYGAVCVPRKQLKDPHAERQKTAEGGNKIKKNIYINMPR